MTPETVTARTRQAFYGWFALAGASLQQIVGAGAFLCSYGVFLPTMCDELGWSRTAVASGFSIGLLCFGLPGPIIGASVARFGPRINIVLGNLLVAVGLAGMFLAQEVWHVYLCYGLAGLGGGFAQFIAGTAIANNWFAKRRSLAMGIATASVKIGGLAFPPLTAALIAAFGWRISWLVLAGMVLIGASLIGGVILVRNRPEDMGQLPDGMSVSPAGETVTRDYPLKTEERPAWWPTGQALRSPTIWLIAAFTSANFFVFTTMLGHQVAYLEDTGFSTMTAATTVSVASAIGIIGSMGFGVLALRYNIRYLASARFAIQIIAFVILLTTRNLALIYIYAVLYGIGTGAITTALTTFIGTYYKRTQYAQILGVVMFCYMIFEALGPSVAGAIHDATATYTPAFIIVTAFLLVGLICAFLARQPKLPRPASRYTYAG